MAHKVLLRLPQNIKLFHKLGLLVSSFLIIAALLLSHGASAADVAFNGPFESDANAVMYGGAATVAELQQKYSDDSSIAAIYAYFFIGPQTIANMTTTAVGGQVTKDGQVFVGGKLVATNALTAGRLTMPGSTQVTKNGVTFYVRPPSVSFAASSLNAFVVMNNGKFLFAILSSCGNPVAATPVTPTPTPTPAPKPIPTPTPTPTPAAPTSTINNVNTNVNNNVNTASATTNVQILQEQQQAQTQTQSTPVVTPAAVTTAVPVATVTTLPNSGAGSVIALFGGTIGVATLGHYLFTRKRLGMNL
jgi:hypothetical protein